MSSRQKLLVRIAPVVVILVVIVTMVVRTRPASAAADVRINAGGPALTVDGTPWSGCTAINACGGYVSGGFAWSENPSAITGASSPDSPVIEKTEWTGGSTSGVAYGATAFTFAIPVTGSAQYSVVLHFTENNKTAVGQRVFDVKINSATVLSNFDIYKEAGGEFKTITRSFAATPLNGTIAISFVRKIENAKINAIEILGSANPPPTQTAAPSTSPTTISPSPTATPTTGSPTGPVGTLAWSTIASTPKPGVEATGGALGGRMYRFGGYFNNVWLPTAASTVYDPATNSWSSLPNTPRPLTHVATVENGRDFILAGGYSTNSNGAQIYGITNVYDFNIDTKTWSSLPSLPAARGSGGMAMVGNVLHFFGGVDTNRQEQPTHWTLDLNNLSAGWRTASAFPYPRTHFAAVSIDTYIYVIGGLKGVDQNSTDFADTYRYDTTSDSWTKMANMPLPMSHMADAAVLYDGRIWVFGGEKSFNATQAEAYVYTPSTNSWTTNTNLPSPRFAADAVNIGGTFYFAGGSMTSTIAWKAIIT